MTARLDQTRFTQPALFVFGYALAQLWMSWGVQPAAMLGHSVGEYVAACLAGVFSLEDALRLVAERARLVQAQPGGAMLAVRLPEADLVTLLADAGLAIAAVNAPGLCVVSGASEAVEAFENELETRRVAARRLKTSHAFHSAMMDPVVEPFTALVRAVTLHAPHDPVRLKRHRPLDHGRRSDRPALLGAAFARGGAFCRWCRRVACARSQVMCCWKSVPARRSLRWRASTPPPRGKRSLSSLHEDRDDTEAVLTALGRLWLEGVERGLERVPRRGTRRRVPLPTYPFERKRYWIEPPNKVGMALRAVPRLAWMISARTKRLPEK